MKKKLSALAVVLALLVSLVPGVRASGSLFFVGVNDDIPLLLPGDTAAYYAGGLLYAPYTVFDAAPAGINVSYSAEGQTLALFTMNQRMVYDLSAGTVTERNGDPIPVETVYRNGVLYIPVEQAAKAFGLSVSLMSSETGCLLLRFTNGTQIYDNEKFLSRSELFVTHMLDAYGGLDSGEIQGGTPAEPGEPEPEEPEPVVELTLYLAFAAEAVSRETLLDLEAMAAVMEQEIPATFFLTRAQLEEDAELVRQLYGRGFTIGLTVDASCQDPAQELRLANEALDQLLFYKTLMVLLPEELEAPSGYVVFRQRREPPSLEELLPEAETPQLMVFTGSASNDLAMLIARQLVPQPLLETTRLSAEGE